MRLTLRNLLAYMDDLLDPESARVIGQKIEESDYASGLLHRIRDVTRRTKLGSPEVIDRKAALDPNTVAEYLDNILPPDRVTDFEKACLDSDVELAEVAACHQVLTLVLGEPAEVRPDSRVRMYHLPETAASHTYIEHDPGETETGSEKHRVDTPPSPSQPRRHPEIPEYLLAARRRRQRLYGLLTVATVVLCAATYLAATGNLGRLLGTGGQPAPPDDQLAVNMPAQPPIPEQANAMPEPANVSPEAPAPLPVPTTETPPAQQTPPESTAPAQPDETPVAQLPASPPANDMAPAAPAENAMTVPAAEAQPVPPPGPIVPVTPAPSPMANAASELPVPVTPLEAPAPAPDPGQMAAMIPAVTPNDQEPLIAEPMVPEVPKGKEIGRLVRPEELALVAQGEGEPYLRITNSQPLQTGQRIVSLPTSRPMLLLGGNLIVEPVGGAELHLLAFDEGSPLHIELAAGRMLLLASEEAGAAQVQLTVGEISGLLSLADATTLVALEVGRADGPIPDPLAQPVSATARLWGVEGNFSWTEVGADEAAFESPMMVDLIAGPGSAPVPTQAPDWVRPDFPDTPDQKLGQRANGLLKKVFDFGKPADLVLRENVSHRLREVRRLARQSLSWIDDFEPIVHVLNDPDRYVEWAEVIDLLRNSIRRGPQTAQAVRDSMEVVYGNRGDELFALLWKYDTPEISKEDARQLVQYLNDETLAFRVASFNNLNRITGKGFYYRADENEMERRQPVQRWTAWAERVPEPPAPAPVPAPAPPAPETTTEVPPKQ